MYGAIASQLESTYLCACVNSFLSSLVPLILFRFPNCNFYFLFFPKGLSKGCKIVSLCFNVESI